MKHIRAIRLLSAPLVLALLASAFLVSPALADDDTNPPQETPSELSVISDSESQEPVPQTGSPIGLNDSPQDLPPQSDEMTSETGSADNLSTSLPETYTPTLDESSGEANLLPDLPDGTDLVVLDQDGEALSLACEAAQEAVIYGDPIWCPTSKAPAPPLSGASAPSWLPLPPPATARSGSSPARLPPV